MIKKGGLKNIILFVGLALAGTILLYLFSSLWTINKIVWPFDVSTVNSIKSEELYQNRKDFTLTEEGIVSESEDPWLIWKVEGTTPSNLRIIVRELSKNTQAQIYYAYQGEEYKEENSTCFTLKKGLNLVTLPLKDKLVRELRFDLTDEANVFMEIDKIEIFEHSFLSPIFLIIFIICEVIFLIILFLLIFKIAWIRKIYTVWMQIDKRKQAIVVLMTLIVITSVLVYGKLYISKKVFIYADVGSDTLNLYFPFYNYLADRLRNLDFSNWTFTYGLGASNINFTAFIMDPFSLFTIVAGTVFGNSVIPNMLLLSQFLKIIVCGLLCYKYLGFFRFSEKAKVISSYIFAFNGFLILWGQHYHLGTFCFWTILILICTEKILRSHKIFIWLSLVTALILSFSVYCGYMILLFDGIYVVFRLLDELPQNQLRFTIKKGIQILFCVFFGILMSAVMFLPQIHNLLNITNRLESSTGLLERLKFYFNQWPDISQITEYFGRMFSNNLSGIGSSYVGTGNYYEAPQLFYSIFFFVLLVQYLCNIHKKNYSRFQVLLRYLATAIVAFLILNPVLSMIFNGFAYPFGRYTFLLMPIFSIITATAWDDLLVHKYKNIFAMLSSVVFMVFVMGMSPIPAGQEKVMGMLKIVNCILLAVFCGFLIKKQTETKNIKQGTYAILLSFTVLNILFDSYLTTNYRVLLSKESNIIEQPSGNMNTVAALKYLKEMDPSFYRIEKRYYDINPYTEALIQGYYGISVYNSTLNKNLIDFNSNFMNSKFTQINYSFTSYVLSPYDLVQYSLLGVKYILTKQLPQNMEQYEVLNQFGDVYVLYNKNVKNVAAYYEYLITREEFNQLSYAQKVDVYSKAMVVEKNLEETVSYQELYEKLEYQDITSDCAIYEDQNRTSEIIEVSDGREIILFSNLSGYNNIYFQFTVECDTNANLLIAVDTGDGYIQENVHYENFLAGEKKSIKYLLPKNAKYIRIDCSSEHFRLYNFRLLGFNGEIIPRPMMAEFMLQEKRDLISGKIVAQTDGYLFLPIVYQDGWEAELDQKPVQLIKADAGFVGIGIKKGMHSLSLKYQQPWKKQGSIISAITAVIWITCFIFQRIKKKKDRDKK